MQVGNVFKDSGYPEATYVERRDGEKENALETQLLKRATVVSISGPSKSGKSVLVDHVIRESERISGESVTIRGNNIESKDDIWTNALERLGIPPTRTIEKGEEHQEDSTKGGGVDAKIIKGNAERTSSKSEHESVTETHSYGLDKILEIQEDDGIVLFIDDAHKIDSSIHQDIAEELKEGYDRGLRICLGYIPFRSDDLTKADMDLTSRVTSIELEHWNDPDLQKIGEKGFDTLNICLDNGLAHHLAIESLGSPHLMQKLCFRSCVKKDIYEKQERISEIEFSDQEIKDVLRTVAAEFKSSYATVYDLLSGSVHGRDAKEFEFIDGTDGDRYTALLRGLAANPPQSSFSLDELKERIREQCESEPPRSGNITQDVQRVDEWISEENNVESYVFDYIEDRKRVEIHEPQLIFYLRWSDAFQFEPPLFTSIDKFS